MNRPLSALLAVVVFASLVATSRGALADALPEAAAHAALRPVAGTLVDWQARHQQLNKLAAEGGGDLLFLGGSTVAGWATEGQPVWQEYYAKRGAVNLGIEGDRTENVLWRINNGNLKGSHPKLIVLELGSDNLVGGENSTQETLDGLTAIVAALQEKLPESQILILGEMPYGSQAGHPARLPIAELNRTASNLADWQQVHYLDVSHELLAADQSFRSECLCEDSDEALSAAGYRAVAEAIEFKIAELLNESTAERIPLFNGADLTGWQAGDEAGAPEGWEVVDGTLAITGRGTDAQTVSTFKNFDFQCEWKVEHRSNSGIFYRWTDYQGYVNAGCEYQVIDDKGRRIAAARDNAVGATVDLYGPCAEKPLRDVGLWNHTRIVANEGAVEHWLNGMRVVDYDVTTEDYQQRLEKSKFRRLYVLGKLYEGSFRFQNYGGSPVSYRDITVAEL